MGRKGAGPKRCAQNFRYENRGLAGVIGELSHESRKHLERNHRWQTVFSTMATCPVCYAQIHEKCSPALPFALPCAPLGLPGAPAYWTMPRILDAFVVSVRLDLAMNSEYITDTWSSLLDADLNSRYWRLMALRYSRREGQAKIFLAVVASTTVASWSLWVEHKWLWQGLSAISALISVALPIVDAPKRVETMIKAQTEWLKLMHEYEELWRSRQTLTEKAFSNKLVELKKREVEVSEKTAKLPSDDNGLAESCYAEVLKTRGLTWLST